MIIVEVGGGLGNQMFDYLFYLALKKRRDDVYLGDYTIRHCGDKAPEHARKNVLGDIFTASEARYASDKDILRLGDCSQSAFACFRRKKLKIVKKTHINLLHALMQVEHVRELNPFFMRIARKIKRNLGIKTTVTNMRVLWKR